MNTKKRLNDSARQELIAIYLESGMKGVESKAREYGVTSRHVANIAAGMGIHRMRQHQNKKDPRWQWAVQRGAVIA